MLVIDMLYSKLFLILLMLARVAGLFIYTPGFSSSAITKKVKVLLAFTISLLLCDYLDYPKIDNFYVFFMYILCELVGGLLIGLISNLFFSVIQCIGGLIDNLLGTGIFQTQGVDGNIQSGISTKLIEYLALILFFTTNSHLYIFYILTYNRNFLTIFDTFQNGSFLSFIIDIFNFIFINGFHLATPFILVLLVIDLALGIVNKSFSSFNVFLFSIPTKFLIFIVLLFYYLLFFSENFSNLININLDLFNSLFSLLAK